jgi:hypothetical protein
MPQLGSDAASPLAVQTADEDRIEGVRRATLLLIDPSSFSGRYFLGAQDVG